MSCCRLPVGVEVQGDSTRCRVWAQNHQQVALVVENESGKEIKRMELESEGEGYFSLRTQLPAGTLYRFQFENGEKCPDPVSRYQPFGPMGPSQVIDSGTYAWTDRDWRGIELREAVVYELHVGTFTPEGTWNSAQRELAELAEIGINVIELLPVADFPGKFGWGYDGVNLFAPTQLYGTPDDLRSFINEAHRCGIAVVLDVVYNHLGPDGNFLDRFSSNYFTSRYKTDWGAAINFDGPNNPHVREYYLSNVKYWIEEFHMDGLRLDATQNIYDNSASEHHILTQIGLTARSAAPHRTILLIAENEVQHPELCRSVDAGGNGLDALWNDDFHHTAVVALTGRREAYYTDYGGTPQEFLSCAKYGYLYQGQNYKWQSKRRGRPALDLKPENSICFLQNHDQIANSGNGQRVHQLSSPSQYRTLLALTLLMPCTPMLFQGQEFNASSPFLYFADFGPELASLVEAGRKQMLSQFPSLADPAVQAQIAPPHDPNTFQRCKLDFVEREKNAMQYLLTKDLLRLRKSLMELRGDSKFLFDGAVLSESAFVLRYFFPNDQDQLLVVNLGREKEFSTVPEPLLAPPGGMRWDVRLSTEEFNYGGVGLVEPESPDGKWHLPAETAFLLTGKPMSQEDLQLSGLIEDTWLQKSDDQEES